MATSTGYAIAGYAGMIADRVRMDSYVRALERAVRPGCVVLDIGAGTGIFSLLACRFGARRVYAVEPDNAIEVAREIAAANGYANRIVFIQDLSTRITLPERADVIISDLRGVLPLFQQHISSIADARRRHLAPGGALIPQRDILWAAIVEAPDLYREHFALPAEPAYGFDMRAARRLIANTWRRATVKAEQLLTEPLDWHVLDYTALESPNASADLIWTMNRAGNAHGLLLWFDAVLAEGIGFSNAPGVTELIYGNAFFPWAEPVSVAAGDRVLVSLAANLVGEDYLWRWETRVLDQGNPGQVKAHFRQSTFFGAPVSPARLHKHGASFVPELNTDGEIRRLVFDSMDGSTSLDEIARALLVRFPERFASRQDALTLAGDISEKYSR
jgi:protein arginine N-methyltransferase 1